MSKTAIGIDLGTTNSRVAVYRHGRVEIVVNEQGSRATPSYVAFAGHLKLIGDAARRQAGTIPKNTIFDFKRLLGKEFNDNYLQEDMKKWPFDVIDDYGKPKVKVEYRDETNLFDPETISALILEKMMKIAENFLGTAVEDAVITVPAYFNDVMRQAMKEAGEITGLNVLQIIDESQAAAIAYGFENNGNYQGKRILVFDMGGGTLDVTILTIVDDHFELKSTSDDPHLGGNDFDNRIVTNCIHQIQIKHKMDISANAIAVNRLRTACEKAKRALSTSQQVSIDIEFILEDSSFTQDFHTTLHRKKFEALNEDIFRKMMKPVKKALAEANLKTSEIQFLILAGGSSRIPKIAQILQDYFKNAIMKKDINPDEVVAYGAAVQASKLAGEESEQLQEMGLMDMTPLSLGIETTGGMMSILIPRNTTVPVTKSKIFTTHKDNQTGILVQVYEGERPLTKDNNLLGSLKLTGIKESRLGQIEITVQFNIDAHGILNVSATENSSEIEQNLSVALEGHLTSQEITEKIQQARELQVKDESERQRMQAQVALETLCLRFQSEFRSLKAKERITVNEKDKMSTILAKTLYWLDINYKSSREEYERKYREVHDKCDPIRRKMQDESADYYETDDISACSFGEID